MQTAVSNPNLRTNPTGQETVSSGHAPRSAAQPAFAHKRGRMPLRVSWRFNLISVVAVSALVAISLLLQA